MSNEIYKLIQCYSLLFIPYVMADKTHALHKLHLVLDQELVLVVYDI